MPSLVKRYLLGLVCAGLVLGTWGLLALTPTPLQADEGVRPSVTPRPTSTPALQARKTPRPIKPVVATMLLAVHPPQDGLWSVVQWQDDLGVWHDVEGWRGSVVKGKTTWWVEQKDFGKGLYRWVVYKLGSNIPIAVSQPFQLPKSPQIGLEVTVVLPEHQ